MTQKTTFSGFGFKWSKKDTQPFVFWLLTELFSSDDVSDEDLRPISNMQFYISLALITAAFVTLGIVFSTFPL